MTRTFARLVAAGVAVLLISGCGAQSRSGAAAVVGGQRISNTQLQSGVDRGLRDPQAAQQFGADRVNFQTLVLNRLVRAQVLEEAARAKGITVSRGDVDAQVARFVEQAGSRAELDRQAAAGGIDPTEIPAFAREVLLEQAIGDALTADLPVSAAQLEPPYQSSAAQFDRVHVRHILVADEAKARQLLAQLQTDRARFAELAAANSIDTSTKDRGGDLGTQGKGTFVPAFDAAVFAAPPGSLLVVQTQFGWHVVEVLERRTTTLQEATPELRRTVLAAPRKQRVAELLRSTAEQIGVTVNPRFGSWDAQLAVVRPVPADDGRSSPAPGTGPTPTPGGRGAPSGGQPTG